MMMMMMVRRWFQPKEVRVAQLQEVARTRCARTTQSRWDLLNVTLEAPHNQASTIVITREGHPEHIHKFTKYKLAEKHVRDFYDDLIYNSECHY